MTEADNTHAMTSALKAHEGLDTATKLAIAVAIGLGIGFYGARTLSHEPIGLLEPGAATSPMTHAVKSSHADMGNAPIEYFPDQFVNQAKEIEPLPPTF